MSSDYQLVFFHYNAPPHTVAVVKCNVCVCLSRYDLLVDLNNYAHRFVAGFLKKCRQILPGNVEIFSVHCYHSPFLQSFLSAQKRSYRSGNSNKVCTLTNVCYQASLRWHYPNQVSGRRSHLPLSLYYKLPRPLFVVR